MATTLRQLIDHLESLSNSPEDINVMLKIDSVDGDWTGVEHLDLDQVSVGDQSGDYSVDEDEPDFDFEKPTIIIRVTSV